MSKALLPAQLQIFRFEEIDYPLSFGLMETPLLGGLSQAERENYLHLIHQVELNPRKIYREIKEFAARHPDIPEIINLLAFAHIRNRKIGLAERLIEEIFQRYPSYLCGRINYADQCVRKNNLAEVLRLFPTSDLRIVSPEKEVFYVAELRGFFVMMAHYQKALKRDDEAFRYYLAAHKIDPFHFGVIHLRKKLLKISFRVMLKRCFSRWKESLS